MDLCLLCETEAVVGLIDFGLQPVCNRYLATTTEPEYLHPLVIGQCEACGLIQIVDPVPAEELSPRFDWITYGEPEGHLDGLADIISKLPGITRVSAICGISRTDDSLLERLVEQGFQNIWRIDPEGDLGVRGGLHGVETIQARFDARSATEIANQHGRPDVVVGRYILEHAQDIHKSLSALKTLVSPGGYVVLEVPDCQRPMEESDYSFVWEEHALYFTERTFRRSLAVGGFSLVHCESYYYPLQNALVGIGGSQPEASYLLSQNDLQEEKARGQEWACGLSTKRGDLRRFLRGYGKKRGNTALYGSGQLGCAFINLLELNGLIHIVVDDNDNKHGYFMPGSHLPIRAASALVQEEVSLCLMSVRPGIQEKLIRNHRAFLEQGGTFYSIFPDGPYQLPLLSDRGGGDRCK